MIVRDDRCPTCWRLISYEVGDPHPCVHCWLRTPEGKLEFTAKTVERAFAEERQLLQLDHEQELANFDRRLGMKPARR